MPEGQHTIPDNKPKPFAYLALGDSYTIGEGVEKEKCFPYQLMAELHNGGLFLPPTIIAQTGWTTRELMAGIEDAKIRGQNFDLVTLLVGVNNQYRGLKLEDYQEEFSGLLDLAIQFGQGNPRRVIVLSIPDWSVTPFAVSGQRSTESIAGEIDQFNHVNQRIGKDKKVCYLDITRDYRKVGGLTGNWVDDQLHPSGNIYQGWVQSLKDIVSEIESGPASRSSAPSSGQKKI